MATAHPFLLVRTAGLPFARIGAPDTDWPALESALEAARAERTTCETALLAAFDDALSALPAGNLRTGVYNARKDFFKKKCLPAPAFLQEMESRIPALAQAMRGWEQAVAALRVARDRCMEQYENALAEANRRIQAVAAEPEFQRALLFAGHDLLEQLPRFLEKNPGQFAKKERHTALAVHRFATRMATRTVPLGRFATVSLHALNVESDPDAEPMPDFGKSAVSPNVALLEALYTVLLREPVFYRALHVRLNPCIAGKNEEAYRWLYFDGETESFQETPATPLLDYLVESLLENNRRMAFAKLLAHLAEMVEATPEALEAWLLDLADTGFLEWELPEAGLTPDWCGGLYRFLGFLPAEPVVVDTASLLQTLRTTARTLPYLPPLEAVAAQRTASGQVREYFGRWKMEGVLPIPPEQLFYEDVERPADVPVPDTVFHNLLNQLADAWSRRPGKPLPARRAALAAYFFEKSPEGKPVGFLEFAREWCNPTPSPSPGGEGGYIARSAEVFNDGNKGASQQANQPFSRDVAPPARFEGGGIVDCAEGSITEDLLAMRDVAPLPSGGGAGGGVGALFQIFQENGRPKAVVNALFPGGGKLFARWLHLFPALQNHTSHFVNRTLPYPWQGYFNANFQPRWAADALTVPGGRIRAGAGGREFLLGNLEVAPGPEGLELRDRVSGQNIQLTDLGLEAPETRPPVMQLLWLLGVPYVLVDALVPDGVWQETAPGIRHRKRYGAGDLVFARAAWVVEETQWQVWLQDAAPEADFFFRIRAEFRTLEVPRHVFIYLPGNQPQHFDLDSPLSVLLLHKVLRQGSGVLHLTEMLPVPEGRAQEFAGEWGE